MPRDLTNLECVAIAHLEKGGACTGHQLRQAFASSSAGGYSGSAGAIYPLLRRLEAAGYLASHSGANGKQAKRLYRATPKGRAAVRSWLCDLDAKAMFADDPLRTRFQYVRQLEPRARAAWFESALESLDQQDRMIRSEYAAPEYANAVDRAVLKSVLAANRLRRRWLSAVKSDFAFSNLPESDDSEMKAK